MAKRAVKTKFFEFQQNNSGGSFVEDAKRGIGPRVWVEAMNAKDANARAEDIGIYFNGCQSGMDCACCGDRWSSLWRDESGKPDVSSEYAFSGTDTVYVHRISGTIERIKKPALSKASERGKE